MNATVRATATGDRRYRIHKSRIEVPGVQIIGWISQVVPYCPPV
jgi:hypothetical protein